MTLDEVNGPVSRRATRARTPALRRSWCMVFASAAGDRDLALLSATGLEADAVHQPRRALDPPAAHRAPGADHGDRRGVRCGGSVAPLEPDLRGPRGVRSVTAPQRFSRRGRCGSRSATTSTACSGSICSLTRAPGRGLSEVRSQHPRAARAHGSGRQSRRRCSNVWASGRRAPSSSSIPHGNVVLRYGAEHSCILGCSGMFRKLLKLSRIG
jgi:hypothetical protein